MITRISRGGRGLSVFLSAWLAAGPALAAIDAPDLSTLEQEQRIKQTAEEKIQRDILEPILGRGKAMVFVDVQLELFTIRTSTVQLQAGAREVYRSAGAGGAAQSFQTQYLLPGVPRKSSVAGPSAGERPEQAQQQEAQQQLGETKQTLATRTIVKSFKVTIIHEDSIAKERLDLVRDRIVDAMSKYDLKPDNILFKPTKFSEAPPWLEFAQPSNLVPLIFAALLGVLLLFLFGPVTLYMGRYVRTLQESKGPQVTVDSKFENAPGQGGLGGAGAGGGAFEGSFETLGKKLEEEEEARMRRFEPFKYINEENLKRLAYLVRREEPWVIAVVLTYLQTEFARAVLSGLPRELQSRVALETATIRQVSREQVMAIDAEIKEKVDFVLGGIEHLCNMLEDADEMSRQNILEYLQNERPSLFEKVRAQIVMFEDLVTFPDAVMQVIVRELKTESMARALQACSPELMQKFLSNMSTGAASLLKEAMEYEKELVESQIQDERKKIMDVVKRLEKEGRVVIRERRGGSSLEGLEEEVSAAETRKSKWGAKPQPVAPGLQSSMGYPMGMSYPMMGFPPMVPGMAPMTAVPMQAAPAPAAAAAPAPEKPKEEAPHEEAHEKPAPKPKGAPKADRSAEAQPYLDAGMQAYNEGRYDEAVSYLEYALSVEPSLWQAHQYLGLALFGLDKTAEAFQHFDRLLELNPAAEMKDWVENLKATA